MALESKEGLKNNIKGLESKISAQELLLKGYREQIDNTYAQVGLREKLIAKNKVLTVTTKEENIKKLKKEIKNIEDKIKDPSKDIPTLESEIASLQAKLYPEIDKTKKIEEELKEERAKLSEKPVTSLNKKQVNVLVGAAAFSLAAAAGAGYYVSNQNHAEKLEKETEISAPIDKKSDLEKDETTARYEDGFLNFEIQDESGKIYSIKKELRENGLHFNKAGKVVNRDGSIYQGELGNPRDIK